MTDKKDTIKIEELKMFLGTELEVMYNNKKCLISSLLDGANEGYVRLYCEDDEEIVVELKDIRPLVRPISSLTKKDWADIVGEECEFRGVGSLGYEFKFKDRISLSFLSLDITKWDYRYVEILAQKNVDIFNWLGNKLAIDINKL